MSTTHMRISGSSPMSLGHGLCRAAATLHEAVLNQELTGMQIAAHRLLEFAQFHRLGPVAWHARAIEKQCVEDPHALQRLAELLDGLELSIEKAIEGPGRTP